MQGFITAGCMLPCWQLLINWCSTGPSSSLLYGYASEDSPSAGLKMPRLIYASTVWWRGGGGGGGWGGHGVFHPLHANSTPLPVSQAPCRVAFSWSCLSVCMWYIYLYYFFLMCSVPLLLALEKVGRLGYAHSCLKPEEKFLKQNEFIRCRYRSTSQNV
jgi:hypothetical protein